MRGKETVFFTDPGKNANYSNLSYRKKVARFQYFANLFRSVVLFDVFSHDYHV